MEVSKFNCFAYEEDSLTVDQQDLAGEELRFSVTVEGEQSAVVLAKDDAISLATDILKHYNVARQHNGEHHG